MVTEVRQPKATSPPTQTRVENRLFVENNRVCNIEIQRRRYCITSHK